MQMRSHFSSCAAAVETVYVLTLEIQHRTMRVFSNLHTFAQVLLGKGYIEHSTGLSVYS
jgi:hypothetical protein